VNAESKTNTTLLLLSVAFAALAVVFLGDLWGRPAGQLAIRLVDTNFLNTATPTRRTCTPTKGRTAGRGLHSVRPSALTQLAAVPAVVLHQLVLVNYGEFASPDDAEAFGAAALGMRKDEYDAQLCELADQIMRCGCAKNVCPLAKSEMPHS